jgi:hypothetical protein
LLTRLPDSCSRLATRSTRSSEDRQALYAQYLADRKSVERAVADAKRITFVPSGACCAGARAAALNPLETGVLYVQAVAGFRRLPRYVVCPSSSFVGEHNLDLQLSALAMESLETKAPESAAAVPFLSWLLVCGTASAQLVSSWSRRMDGQGCMRPWQGKTLRVRVLSDTHVASVHCGGVEQFMRRLLYVLKDCIKSKVCFRAHSCCVSCVLFQTVVWCALVRACALHRCISWC